MLVRLEQLSPQILQSFVERSQAIIVSEYSTTLLNDTLVETNCIIIIIFSSIWWYYQSADDKVNDKNTLVDS